MRRRWWDSLAIACWNFVFGKPVIGRLIRSDRWVSIDEDGVHVLHVAPRWIWDSPAQEAMASQPSTIPLRLPLRSGD